MLDLIGRGEILLSLGEKLDHAAAFLGAHQELGYQIAPWVLMVAGVLSLAFLQWPGLAFWRKKVASQFQKSVALSGSGNELVDARLADMMIETGQAINEHIGPAG